MGMTKCSQYCERSLCKKSRCEAVAAPPCYEACDVPDDVYTAGKLPFARDLNALAYMPPPPADILNGGEALIRTTIPPRPRSAHVNGLPNAIPTSSSTNRDFYSSCGRPGDPPNQVYVKFLNDLEGFLPYTLVISQDQGLEFTSLTQSPDFKLNPLNLLTAERVDYDTLSSDAFLVSHSRSVQVANAYLSQRTGSSSPSELRTQLERDRLQPPYKYVVQLSVKRSSYEGGQVLVFLTVQSEGLAEELVRSCQMLKRSRSRKLRGECSMDEWQQRGVSRGCPTPRSLGSRTPSAATCSIGPTPSRTPALLSPRKQQLSVQASEGHDSQCDT